MWIESVGSVKQAVDAGQEPNVQAKDQMSKKPSQEQDDKKADVSFLKDVLEVAQNHCHVSGVNLDFSVHDATGTVKVDVTDKETGEVIREIPPQQILDLMARIDEMMGMLYDEKA